MEKQEETTCNVPAGHISALIRLYRVIDGRLVRGPWGPLRVIGRDQKISHGHHGDLTSFGGNGTFIKDIILGSGTVNGTSESPFRPPPFIWVTRHLEFCTRMGE